MSEADLIDQLLARSEVLWNLNQWWVSVSFAVMLAAYVGAERLSRILVGLMVGLYSLYTITVWEHVLSLVSLHSSYMEALSLLADSSQLGVVGQAYLEQQDNRKLSIVFPAFMVVAFLITNGFVFYSYRKYKKE